MSLIKGLEGWFTKPAITVPVVDNSAPSQTAPPLSAIRPALSHAAEVPDTFHIALKETLVWEGGNDDDPHDPGGRTSRGIVQREYDQWCKTHGEDTDDVWDATDARVAAIYYDNYWCPLSCASYPAAIAVVLFDYGVNSGNHQAVKDAQRCIGVVADGVLGPQTVHALSIAEPVTFVHRLDAHRLALLEGLSTWEYFGKGWRDRVHGEDAFATKLA